MVGRRVEIPIYHFYKHRRRKSLMANKLLPATADLMQELKEMEDRLSCKQSVMRNVSTSSPKRFPRFTISTEMSLSSILGEISANEDKVTFDAESN
jgi:hypothetical protein